MKNPVLRFISLGLVAILLSAGPVLANSKTCDKQCQVQNAKLTKEAVAQKLKSNTALTRAYLIYFLSNDGPRPDKELRIRVVNASQDCIASLGGTAQESFNAFYDANKLMSNIWSTIISGIITSPLRFPESQISQSVLERALQEFLKSRKWELPVRKLGPAWYNAIKGELTFCG